MSFLLYVSLFDKKTSSHVCVCEGVSVCIVTYYCILMYIFYQQRVYTCRCSIYLYMLVYTYTFVFSETGVSKPTKENYLSPPPSPSALWNMPIFFISLPNCQYRIGCSSMKGNTGILSPGLRVWANETCSWDKRIYWVCYVSNVTKVEDLRNALCGSFHTLWSHNSSLIQMQ